MMVMIIEKKNDEKLFVILLLYLFGILEGKGLIFLFLHSANKVCARLWFPTIYAYLEACYSANNVISLYYKL